MWRHTYLIVNLFKTKKISLHAACSVGVQCTGRKPHQRSKIVQTKIRHREKGKQIHALLCLDTNKIAMNNNIPFFYTAVQCDIPSYKQRVCSIAVQCNRYFEELRGEKQF